MREKWGVGRGAWRVFCVAVEQSEPNGGSGDVTGSGRAVRVGRLTSRDRRLLALVGDRRSRFDFLTLPVALSRCLQPS